MKSNFGITYGKRPSAITLSLVDKRSMSRWHVEQENLFKGGGGGGGARTFRIKKGGKKGSLTCADLMS